MRAPPSFAHAGAPSSVSPYDCAPRQTQRFVLTYAEQRIISRAGKRTLRIEVRFPGHLVIRYQTRPVVTHVPSPLRATAFPQRISLGLTSSSLFAPRGHVPIVETLRKQSPLLAPVRSIPHGHGSRWEPVRPESAARPFCLCWDSRRFFVRALVRPSDHHGSWSEGARTAHRGNSNVRASRTIRPIP
jgi:hypothetical protein